MTIRLEGFSPAEEAMLATADEALRAAGYDTGVFQVLIRAELPPGYRGSTWGADGAVLASLAFSSQAMLNHVLEEELLHLLQKTASAEQSYGPEYLTST